MTQKLLLNLSEMCPKISRPGNRVFVMSQRALLPSRRLVTARFFLPSEASRFRLLANVRKIQQNAGFIRKLISSIFF